MIREILFGGKRKGVGNEWIYGDLNHIDGSVYIFDRNNTYNSPDWYEVIPETVGQYINKLDKNGSKIFDGSIIKAKIIDVIHPQDLHKLKDEYITSLVYFDKYNSCFSTDFNCFSFCDSHKVEVIGNIYDNPDLIK